MQHAPKINRIDEARNRRNQVSISIKKEKKEAKSNHKRFKISDAAVVHAIQNIPLTVIHEIHSDNEEIALKGVVELRKILCSPKCPPIQNAIDWALHVKMLEFLKNKTLQYEAAWVLTNIAGGTSNQTNELININVIPSLSALLLNDNEMLREQSVWALANIASDSSRACNLVLLSGIFPMIVRDIYATKNISYVRCLMWMISIICQYEKKNEEMFMEIIRMIVYVIHTYMDDVSIMSDVCVAVYALEQNKQRVMIMQANLFIPINRLLQTPSLDPYLHSSALKVIRLLMNEQDLAYVLQLGIIDSLCQLICTNNDYLLNEVCATIDALLHLNIVDDIIYTSLPGRLIQHLHSTMEKIHFPALKVIGTIFTGNDVHCDHVLRLGVIEPLKTLLHSLNTKIIKMVCWIFSNMAAGSEFHIECLIQNKVTDLLVELFEYSTHDIQKEIIFVFGNILFGGNDVQRKHALHNPTVIKMFADALKNHDIDVICFSLTVVDILLTCHIEMDISNTLEKLEDHVNEEISHRASSMIETFFS